MNLGEHLNAILSKAGVEVDNPALVELTKKVATLDISDELVSKFNSTYLTVEAAKSNPEIKKHFYAPALNGVDSEIANLLQDPEFDEDSKNEVLSEKSTYKKIPLLMKKVRELEAKKVGATKKESVDINKKIEEHNEAMKLIKLDHQKALADKDKELSDKLKNVYLTQKLSDPKLKYASELASQENFLLPKTALEKELKAKKLRVVIENEDLQLETEDGTPYFENNDKIDFTKFRDRVLAQHKFLSVTDQSQQTQTQTQTVQTQTNPVKAKGSAMYDQMIAEATKQ